MRVDSHLYAGYSVPPYYDSLLGKVIAWGRDRNEAAARMERALTETVITGVPQTVSFLQRIVGDEEFRSGAIDTEFIPSHIDRLLAPGDTRRKPAEEQLLMPEPEERL